MTISFSICVSAIRSPNTLQFGVVNISTYIIAELTYGISINSRKNLNRRNKLDLIVKNNTT